MPPLFIGIGIGIGIGFKELKERESDESWNILDLNLDDSS